MESSKSYGSGKRSSDIEQRVEGLEGDAFGREVPREPVARKNAVAGEGGTPVRIPVAHEDERAVLGQRPSLAAVAAHRTRPLVPEAQAPAVPRRLGEVRAHVQLDSFAPAHRQ